MPVSGPTVVRRQLGRRLRNLREKAGKTEREVEDAKLVSRTKLWRIESGKVPVKVPDVRALCWFYGADAETTDALANLAVGTAGQGWWEDYGDVVPDWFKLYVGLEGVATRIQSYDGELVPGPLQTEDYTRAVYRAARPDDSECREEIERHVALRRQRQEALLRRDQPPTLQFVLGAGAVLRQVGGPEVMAAQVEQLRHFNRLDHVEITVIPLEAGAHAAMLGAFSILEFSESDDPDVVYFETQAGARYLEKYSEIQEYRRIFELIHRQAVPIEEYP